MMAYISFFLSLSLLFYYSFPKPCQQEKELVVSTLFNSAAVHAYVVVYHFVKRVFVCVLFFVYYRKIEEIQRY